jgi:hypothetical protein
MVFPVVGGDGKPTGYDIDNSLRFNDGDSPYLNRTFATPTNRKKFTFSAWYKRSTLSTTQYIISYDSGGLSMGIIGFSSTDKFIIYDRDSSSGSADIDYNTTQLFRDVSAWYHIVVSIDTTDGTSGDRVKIYVNGTRITSFDTSTAPAQNYDTIMNSAVSHDIGRWQAGSSYYDGYMSEINYVDGQALDSSYFGETDDNGVWIPKVYDGTYGNSGFFLEFKQTGTSQNSSGIGADTSGNDNHMSVTNLAATDVTVDTPTNNFATLNPLINSNGTYTLSEGNTKFVADGSNGWNTTTATMGFSKGKWYWEQKFTQVTGSASFAGLVKDDVNHADDDISGQDDSEGVLYYATGNYMFGSSGTYVSGGASFGNSWGDAGDIISVAADFDNNKMYFAKNGTYQGSGNPSTGSNGLPISEGAQGLVAGSFNFVFPYAGAYYADDGCEWNFGNAPFSISSGNADANGYGNFEYAVPTGFYSLCTKNLAEYG